MTQISAPRAISDIDRWFNTEISRWRSGAALVWILLVTGPVLYLTLSLATVSVLHPVNWIIASVLRVLSPWTWFYLLLVVIMVAVLTTQSTKQLTVLSVVYSSRWKKLLSVLRIGRLYTICISGLLCAGISWCYARLLGEKYDTMMVECHEESEFSCLNEHHLFVVLHGLYVGVVFRCLGTINGQHHMIFPTIQQSKFFQLKSSILHMIGKSIWTTLNRIKYFYIAYYIILGVVIKRFLSVQIGLHQRASETPINSLGGVLDVSLLWHCMWSGAMINFLLTLGAKIHKLYHTEWFPFAIETTIEKYRNLVLHQALKCDHNPLVQYHGYQDLYLLSKQSLPRRRQVFALTQLGGHPQNWASVSSQSLTMLRTFIDELSAYNTRIMADGSMKQLNTEKYTSDGEVRHRIISGEQLTTPGGGTGVTTNRKSSFLHTMMADMKKTRVIGFFLSEDPDACSRKLFTRSQIYIWAVEALSYLVCASYNEDKFGVVQKSLPDILQTLLMLQEQVEKHFRLVPTIARRERDDGTDMSLRGALKVTLKVAIYRVVARFEAHIRSVPLSSDHMRRLTHFLDYKE